jgi:uncharacterized membrane protein
VATNKESALAMNDLEGVPEAQQVEGIGADGPSGTLGDTPTNGSLGQSEHNISIQETVPTSASEVIELATEVLQTIEMYQGTFDSPLPPPQILAMYEDVLPGSVDRLFKLVEEEAIHRRHGDLHSREMEAIVVRGNNRRAYLGQAAAFAIAIVLTGVGAFLIDHDHDAAGTTLVTTTVLGLVTIFALGRRHTESASGAPKQDD